MDEELDPTQPYGAVTAFVWCVDDRWLLVAATRSDAGRLAKAHGWLEAESGPIRRATQNDVDLLSNTLAAALDG
jgi:hypothetical protein